MDSYALLDPTLPLERDAICKQPLSGSYNTFVFDPNPDEGKAVDLTRNGLSQGIFAQALVSIVRRF